VVGAGPTGLATACRLRDPGVDVAMLDDEAAQGVNTSRAAVVHARTLEVLEELDVIPRLRAEGCVAPAFTGCHRAGVLARLDFAGLPRRAVGLHRRHPNSGVVASSRSLGRTDVQRSRFGLGIFPPGRVVTAVAPATAAVAEPLSSSWRKSTSATAGCRPTVAVMDRAELRVRMTENRQTTSSVPFAAGFRMRPGRGRRCRSPRAPSGQGRDSSPPRTSRLIRPQGGQIVRRGVREVVEPSQPSPDLVGPQDRGCAAGVAARVGHQRPVSAGLPGTSDLPSDGTKLDLSRVC